METPPSDWVGIVGRAFGRWQRHSAPTLSAAMAFYVLISIAPLSVIAVGLAGRMLGDAQVREYVVETSERILGDETAVLVSEILETPWVRHSQPVGNLLAIVMLVFASTAGFNHLRESLNRIFESPSPTGGVVWGMIRGRALAFLIVLAFGVTILASLLVRILFVAIASLIETLDVATPLPLAPLLLVEILALLTILTVSFAVVFRVLPDRKLGWRPLLVGSATTSVLFLLGEWVIGQYLGRVGMASAFGLAGSSVVLAAWVYYSSMVFFFGAALTCVYAEHRLGEGPASGDPGAAVRRVAIGLALLASVPASAGRVDAQQDREARVRVEVRGLSQRMRDNVLATLSIARQPSRTSMSEERVRLLMRRVPDEVRASMEPFGYYGATSRDSLVYDGRRWRVSVDVEPGLPVRLTDVVLRVEGPGADDTALMRIHETTALATGRPLAHAEYESTKVRLIGAALDRGYLDATFDSSAIFVDRVEREARVVLVLQTGPRYALGEVTFFQDVLNPELLQDLVPWVPGDAFSRAQLLELQTSLTADPYFSSAEIVPARDRAEGLVVPIDVVLTPTPGQLYSIGGGYGTDTGLRATFGAEFRRLNRAGHRATIDAWLAQVERRATGSYLIPLGDRPGTLLSLNAGWIDANPVTSETETWLMGATVDGILGDWRTQVSATLERAAFTVGTQSGVSTLFLLGSGLSRVTADDRIEPSRGRLVRLRARASHDAVLGDVRVFDMSLELRWIRGFGGRYRVLWRGEVGSLVTSDFSKLPGSLRYFAGGDRSVRGYAYKALGPVDEFGDVIGGTKLVVTGLEFDAAVLTSWRVALFADIGNALDSWDDPFEAGAGAGIRWRSPVGMVRLDGAFAVTRSGWPFRIHLNLGPEL